MRLVQSCNAPLVEPILLYTASVGQSWGVEDANLGEKLHTPYPPQFKSTSTYHSAVLARKLIQAGRVGLTLVVRTTLFIGSVEDIEVVVINVVAREDIADEFHDRGLSNTSLSNKKDGVSPIRSVF